MERNHSERSFARSDNNHKNVHKDIEGADLPNIIYQIPDWTEMKKRKEAWFQSLFEGL